MPLYEYQCVKGHHFEALVRRHGEEPTKCTRPVGENKTCDEPVKRVFSVPASKFPGANKW